MTIGWGILGCGDVTEQKSGPPAFNHAGRSSLVAVMRRDGAKAADYAQRHGVASSYSEAQKLIDDPAVTAVYIATPPGAHLELALRVAAARKPCIVEKPMARNLPESDAMQRAFAEAGVPLFVAYYRRCYPRYVWLHRMLQEEKVLGDITFVSYRKTAKPKPSGNGWRTGDASSSGGGLFLDVGSHALDLLDFLLGPLREVRGCARGKPGAVEDRVACSFALDNGAVGTATWDFTATDNEDTLELRGTGGVLVVPHLKNGDTIVLRRAGGEADKEEKFVHPPPATVQQPFVESVIEALEASDPTRCPSTAVSALRTAAAMDAVLGPYYGGRDDLLGAARDVGGRGGIVASQRAAFRVSWHEPENRSMPIHILADTRRRYY